MLMMSRFLSNAAHTALYNAKRSISTNAAAGIGGKQSLLGPALFTAVSLTAGGLFVWQTKRYFWKVDLLQTLNDRTKEDPIVLSASSASAVIADHEHLVGRKVLLTGEFDHDHELVLGLRASPPGLVTAAAQGMGSNPQGYFIITPLKVSSQLTVFVNRGWVPRTAKGWSRPQGSVTLVTLIGEPEKGGYFAPAQDEKTLASGKVLWLEERLLRMLAQQLTGSEQVHVFDAIADNEDSDTRTPPYAKTIDLMAQMHVHPSTHMAYAFTWFCLSIAGLVMTYKKFRGPRTLKRIIK